MRCTVLLLLTVWGGLAENDRIQKIPQCSANCLQGISCTEKSYMLHGCRRSPRNSTAVHNVSVSTVMLCEKTQHCTLHLEVAASLRVNEHIWGVAICMFSAGVQEFCRALTIPRQARQRLTGQQLSVHNDCFAVKPGQEVQVTVQTVPSYCNLTWSQVYRVQECDNHDLTENVPECITGRIAYTVQPERRELSVRVSGVLEDRDYNLRLCLKGFVCTSISQRLRIKKNTPRNGTFQYSRALPCLCIEGWSSMSDARRVQVCPFRNHTDELWSGVTFDPEQEVLSWEPACPVKVEVSLCQSMGEYVCHDLANSTQTVISRKVVYSKVDPHPKLCVKFNTTAGSWIKCPFSKEKPAWDLAFTSAAGHQKATVTSNISTNLSLCLCDQSKPSRCSSIISVSVEKLRSVDVDLSTDVCRPDMCVQVTREDVNFSTRTVHCDFLCCKSSQEKSDHEMLPWILLAIGCSVLLIPASLIVFAMIKVFKKIH